MILYQFGFRYESNFISLVLFSKLYEVVSWLTGLIQTQLTRHFEYQADAFAAKDESLRVGLCRGLIKIHINNAANLNPYPLYAMLKFSHPQLTERLAALKYDPEDPNSEIEMEEIQGEEERLNQLANQHDNEAPKQPPYFSLNEESE